MSKKFYMIAALFVLYIFLSALPVWHWILSLAATPGSHATSYKHLNQNIIIMGKIKVLGSTRLLS